MSIIAGTGHRPDKLGGYTLPAHLTLVGIAKAALHMTRPAKVITGCAMGWDQALGIAALELNIPLVAAIPFRGFYRRWTGPYYSIHREILLNADEVHYITHGAVTEYRDMVIALDKRNRWMVDRCTSLLSMWNGTPGGTANCLKYAARVNKQHANLYPNNKHLLMAA